MSAQTPIELVVYDEHDDGSFTEIGSFDLMEALDAVEDADPVLWKAVVGAMGERVTPLDGNSGGVQCRDEHDSRLFDALYTAFDTQPNSSESEIVAQLAEQFPDENREELKGVVKQVRHGWRTDG